MKTSCINHPPQEPLIIKHRWQVQVCDGDGCAAGLLSFFEYWHNIKLRTQVKAAQSNRIAEMHGDDPVQDTSLFQWHTTEELKASLFEYNEKRIRAGIKLLEENGFISVHRNPNPKYAFDKTKYFLFHPAKVNQWLVNKINRPENKLEANTMGPDPIGHIEGTVESKRMDGSVENTEPYGRIDRTVQSIQPKQYHKNTSKISSEISSKGSNETQIVAQAQQMSVENPDPVASIFSHWKASMDQPEAKLDEVRKRAIHQALQAGYSVTALCQAISGCANTPHNMGDNNSGQRFDSLQLIFRDADQIDRFIRNSQMPPHHRKQGNDLFHQNLSATQIWLAEQRTKKEEYRYGI